MSATELVILAASGLVAGAINAVAGGGSLITLPALIIGGSLVLIAILGALIGFIMMKDIPLT